MINYQNKRIDYFGLTVVYVMIFLNFTHFSLDSIQNAEETVYPRNPEEPNERFWHLNMN